MLRHAGMFRGDIRCQMGSAGELLRATLGLQFQLVKLVNLLHRLTKPSLTLANAVSEMLARTSLGHRLNSRENPVPISAFASFIESNTQHRAMRQILTLQVPEIVGSILAGALLHLGARPSPGISACGHGCQWWLACPHANKRRRRFAGMFMTFTPLCHCCFSPPKGVKTAKSVELLLLISPYMGHQPSSR